MPRALVTGAAGFVGRHLVRRLLDDGWDVVAAARPGAPPAAGAEPLPLDAADGAAWERVSGCGADVAFSLHAARRAATAEERAATVSVNATSAAWLVEALPATCEVVVRLGSSTEYAAAPVPLDESAPLVPRGFFGGTKAAGSLLQQAAAAQRGLRSVVLRAFQVYGPGDHDGRLVPSALRAAASGAVLPLTAPGSRRDWVWVGDVVDACVRAAATPTCPPVLNIGTGVQTANEELVALVGEVTGRSVAVDVGAHPGRGWDTSDWVSDPSLARAALGWEPRVDLREGLRRTWQADRA